MQCSFGDGASDRAAGPAAGTVPGTGGRRPPRPAARRTAAPAASSRRFLAAVAGGVTALAVTLTAGCGSGIHASATAPNTLPRALRLAVKQSHDVASFTATISERVSGARAGTITGAIRMQAKPVLILHEAFTLPAAGRAVPGAPAARLAGNRQRHPGDWPPSRSVAAREICGSRVD
jgi:hypothetical protein